MADALADIRNLTELEIQIPKIENNEYRLPTPLKLYKPVVLHGEHYGVKTWNFHSNGVDVRIENTNIQAYMVGRQEHRSG